MGQASTFFKYRIKLVRGRPYALAVDLMDCLSFKQLLMASTSALQLISVESGDFFGVDMAKDIKKILKSVVDIII